MNYEGMAPRWAFHDDTAHAVLYQYSENRLVRWSSQTLCGLSHISTAEGPAMAMCDTCLKRLGFKDSVMATPEAKG